LSINLGQRWDPVENLPAPFEGLGVLICLDFLDQEGEARRQLVGGKLSACRWLAVPSLTPPRSAEQEFADKAEDQSKRYKRPVVYANSAANGGSCVFSDSERFDSPPSPLPAEQEGVVIADIDLSLQPAGASTPYNSRRAIGWSVTATLVYAGAELEYGDWLEEWCNQNEQHVPKGEGVALDELQSWFTMHPPPEQARCSQLRRERLGVLIQEASRWNSRQAVELMAAEVLLPPAILPTSHLKALLAKGASDQVNSWREVLVTDESA